MFPFSYISISNSFRIRAAAELPFSRGSGPHPALTKTRSSFLQIVRIHNEERTCAPRSSTGHEDRPNNSMDSYYYYYRFISASSKRQSISEWMLRWVAMGVGIGARKNCESKKGVDPIPLTFSAWRFELRPRLENATKNSFCGRIKYPGLVLRAAPIFTASAWWIDEPIRGKRTKMDANLFNRIPHSAVQLHEYHPDVIQTSIPNSVGSKNSENQNSKSKIFA